MPRGVSGEKPFRANIITSLSSSKQQAPATSPLLRSDAGTVLAHAPVPHLTSSSSSSGSPHRLPLAPLAPQSVTMPSSPPHRPSPPSPYAWQDSAPDPTPAGDVPRQFIGRQIVDVRTLQLDEEQRSPGLQPPRRRPAAQPGAGSSRTTRASHGSRRNSRASINSNSSSRRTSLPALHHLQAPTTAATSAAASSSSPTMPTYSSQPPGGDDIYSNLSTFTFGAASAGPSVAYDADTEMIGPLQTPTIFTRKASVDRTPRPSVSGVSSGSRRRDFTSDGSDDDTRRQSIVRGKMRAVDAGARRSSVPVNTYLSPEESTSGQGSSASDAEPDAYAGEYDLDTDVEFDMLPSRPMRDSDTASVNTFGGGGSERFARPGPPSVARQADSGEESSEDQHGWAPDMPTTRTPSSEARSPMTFALRESDDELSPMSPPPQRPPPSRAVVAPWEEDPGPSAYAQIPMSSGRDREGSQATVRRRSQSMDAAERPSFVPSTVQPDGSLIGFNLEYILAAAGGRRDSTLSPLDARRGSTSARSYESRQSISGGGGGGFAFPGWGRDLRRGSAVTARSAGSDDAFFKHIRDNDTQYQARVSEWSFRKEKAEGGRDLIRVGTQGSHAEELRTRNNVPVGQQEIWRCEYVGRFKADRAMFRADPSKPVQQRLTIRHIIDPFSKGNNRGGPGTLIHKHSRAVAFSIFREHNLASISNGRSNQMSVNFGILLATKRVQQQYTNTKSTSKLNTHSLLDDRASRASSNAPGSFIRPRSQSRSHRDRDRDKDRKKTKGKEKEKEKNALRHTSPPAENEPGSSRARGQSTTNRVVSASADHHSSPDRSMHSPSPSGSIIASTSASARSTRSPSPGLLNRTPSQSTATSDTSAYPQTTPSDGSMYTQTTISEQSIYPPYLHPYSAQSRERIDSVELDYEHTAPRTSHQEAFATLESGQFEMMRKPDRHESRSIGEKLRRFIGNPSKNSQSQSGPSSSALRSGNFTPPWLTMAPRADQEEHERVIQNLNESFKDVGLLPSTEPRKKNKPKPPPKRKPDNDNVFDLVPDEALFMIVPLWPKDTEPAFAEDDSRYKLPIEEHQYLLVWYVKKLEQNKRKKGREQKKGRDHSHLLDLENDPSQLEAFHVCARLLGYQQLRQSGVRCPINGLSVTGPMQDAIRAIPSPEIREREYDPVVIAVWHNRDAGMELVPEALEKFGLCDPRMDTDPDEAIPLSSLGRAAIEMAWLGGMALTSFPPIAGNDI